MGCTISLGKLLSLAPSPRGAGAVPAPSPACLGLPRGPLGQGLGIGDLILKVRVPILVSVLEDLLQLQHHLALWESTDAESEREGGTLGYSNTAPSTATAQQEAQARKCSWKSVM